MLFCVHVLRSGRMKLGSFMSESCNDSSEMYKKRDTCTVFFFLIETHYLFVVLVAVAVVVA